MNRFIRVLLCTILSSNTAYGDIQPLTLNDAVNIAVENNPQLSAAKAKLKVSQANILTAGARPNPNFVSDNGVAESTYRMGIEQTIELGGKRRQRIELAKAQTAVVSAELTQTFLELKTEVRRDYTRLYYYQQREKAYKEILNTTEELKMISEKREQVGDIPKLDVLQASIANLNADNELQTVSSEMVEAWNALNTALNVPLENRYTLEAPQEIQLKTLLLSDLMVMAETNRPELKQIQENKNVAIEQLQLAKVNRVPNLSLTVGPDVVVPTGSANQVNVFAIANMSIPVWNRQQGPIQSALAAQSQYTSELQAKKNIVRLEVSNAYNKLITQQARVHRYEAEILPKSQTILEKARSSFVEGKSDIIIPINAQQAYINTRLGYLQALVDMQNAISDLERAVGTQL